MRGFLKFLLAVVVVVVVAWLGLWWYAQGRMQAGFTNWVNQTQANPDIKVSYDSMSRGTSPLAATLNLVNLRIQVQPDANMAPVTFVLPSFALRINAADPTLVHFDLPPQVNIDASDGTGTVRFGSVAVTEQINPAALFNPKVPAFNGTDATADNIDLLASAGSLLVLHIDHVMVHAVVNENANAGQNALHMNDELDGVAVSPLLTKIASIPFDGKINQLTNNLTLSGPLPANWQASVKQFDALPPTDQNGRQKLTLQEMQDWAAHGGHGNFGTRLAIGPSTLKASAAVRFDASAQPSGTASLTADHLAAFAGAVVNAYPMAQNDVDQLEAMLSPYISATGPGGQTLNMHVAYGAGGVMINGHKVADMPPVDWTTLENAPVAHPPRRRAMAQVLRWGAPPIISLDYADARFAAW